MKFFDGLKKPKKNATLTQLINEPYEQKYFEQCKFIWKIYIPTDGQSTVLQGELLRAVEKLRYEAQNNGNINWDDNFEYFCDFLQKTLCAQDIYTDDEKEKYKLILNYFRKSGIEKAVYVYDNLYDILADAVGKFYACNPEPIPHVINPSIYR